MLKNVGEVVRDVSLFVCLSVCFFVCCTDGLVVGDSLSWDFEGVGGWPGLGGGELGGYVCVCVCMCV